MSFAVDANILLYASDQSSPVYLRAASFLRKCVEGTDIFCLAWPSISAYLRIATHAAIFRHPLSPGDAMANIDGLLSLPHVRVLGEDTGFWERYRDERLRPAARGVAGDASVEQPIFRGLRVMHVVRREETAH